MAFLPTDREDAHDAGFLSRYLIEYAEIADTQLPRSKRIGPQRLPTSCLDRRFTRQLALDGVEDAQPFGDLQPAQVRNDDIGEPNPVLHCVHPFLESWPVAEACGVRAGAPATTPADAKGTMARIHVLGFIVSS